MEMKAGMKKLFFYILLITERVFAQSAAPPQVMNAAGGTAKVNGNYFGYNIGEPIAATGHPGTGTNYYTQGFLQPDYKVGTAFSASVQWTGESCKGSNDGFIKALPVNNKGSVTYTLNPPLAPVDTSGSATGLSPGTYTLTMQDSAGRLYVRVFTLNASTKECEDTVYHAFSPNGDGLNDLFIIPGITRFDNHVYFFNRWGQLVWDAAKYDNVRVVWDGRDKTGVVLTPGTYFYVIDRKGSSTQKNWVEITR
jgi:gliding motility-associated-like protein